MKARGGKKIIANKPHHGRKIPLMSVHVEPSAKASAELSNYESREILQLVKMRISPNGGVNKLAGHSYDGQTLTGTPSDEHEACRGITYRSPIG